jgi:hypothetical protein
MKLRFCIVLSFLPLFLSGDNATPEPDSFRGVVLPAAPIYAGDNAVVVHSSQRRAGYRGPVLMFVNRIRDLFQSGLNMRVGSQHCPLEIVIGEKSDGDKSVLTARLRDDRGNLRERIVLPDPEAADLDRLRRALAVAFLRVWMVEAGGTDKSMQDLPNWLIDGMMRYMHSGTRQSDLDHSYALWSDGALPPAEQLYAFESEVAEQEPAVAAVLAGWFLEKRARAFKQLLRDASSGIEWNVANISELLAENFAGDFDRMLDLRMLELGRRVIEPGLTTEGIVSRFRSELLLFPTDYGMIFSRTNAYCTFDRAISLAELPAVRKAAHFQALKIRAASAGRDGTLLALSEEYVRFLRELALGESPERMSAMLEQAERKRRKLEEYLAKGAVLRRRFQ